MTGKIVQQVGVHNENNILTQKDGESFFKFEQTNYNRYGKEFRTINSVQQAEYGNNVTFNIPLIGNILHKCFFEIKIPDLIFKDDIITNNLYINYKNNKLSSLQSKIDEWNIKFINLKNYSNIQLEIYNKINQDLNVTNITLIDLNNSVQNITNKYSNLNDLQNLVDPNILSNINIKDYILNLASFSKETILIDINTFKNNIFNNNEYHYSNMIYYQKKYQKINYGKISYNWNKYLSHHFLTDVSIEIDGQVIDNYSNDFLHLYQLSKLEDYMIYNNYNNLIGNNLNYTKDSEYNPNIEYTFSSNNSISFVETNRDLSSNKIYTPIIFWFCNDSRNSLPLIALDNIPIQIKIDINDITNLIYFQNWEEDFNELLFIDIPKEDHLEKFSNNTIEKYSGLNIESVELLLPENIYRYKCKNLNQTLLSLHFNGLDTSTLLDNYGTLVDGEKIINLNDYIFLMNNLRTETYLSQNDKILIGGYHYFVDYNFLINQIPNPSIKLLAQYGYLDDVEKTDLKMNRLKYLVKTHHESETLINYNYAGDNVDINFDFNGLVDNLFYFIRPKALLNKLSSYGKSDVNNFSDFSLFSDNFPLDNIEINFGNENNIVDAGSVSNYYNYVIPNYFLSGILPDGVFYKNFSLTPFELSPSGTINTFTLNQQNILLELNQVFKNAYFNSKNNDQGLLFKIIYTKLKKITIKDGNFNIND